MENKIKLVVVNGHTLGYIDPHLNPSGRRVNTLHASLLKGANWSCPMNDGMFFVSEKDDVRLASEADFRGFRVCFDGYRIDPRYEHAEVYSGA